MKRLSLSAFHAACLLAVSGTAASAQSLVVEVTGAESGNALAGAFVSLLDENGRVMRSALTNEAGRSLFLTPGGGRYQLTVELVGRQTHSTGILSVAAEETRRLAVSLVFQPIALAEIRVDPDQRCRLRPADAMAISQVWESARQALAVQAWTEGAGVYRLDISTYDRDLDATGRKVERETRRGRSRVTRAPFASLPPEELVSGGFIRTLEDGGHEYYGADAALLLSDVFLDTHCFRLERSRDVPGAIGLAFEPVRTHDLPDIAGTLWVDEATAHLRFLEYSYTRSPYEEARGLAGGRVDFVALPGGAWIIERWWIRAPILVRQANLARAGDSGIRVAGIRETGGEVIGISDSRQTIARTARGSVRGVVWDSTRATPLADATVLLAGTEYSAQTDSAGRFVIDGLPNGVFTAQFSHGRLDSLHIGSPEAEVEVTAARSADVQLAIPSEAAILLAACFAEKQDAPGSVVSGVVTDRKRGGAIPGATVRVQWQEVETAGTRMQARNEWLDVTTDEDGLYVACGVPVDELVHVHASLLTYGSDSVAVGFDAPAHRKIDLQIDLPAAVAARSGIAATERATGAQGIQGVLLERESGAVVRDAEVTIRSLSGELVATGLSDDGGHFRLPTPTPGRYLVTVSSLGYRSLDGEPIDVSAGKLTILEIRMVPQALALEPLVVTAEPRAYHLEVEGFYRRMEGGLGRFITPEVFEERRPRRSSDLLFGLPGVNVADPTTGSGGRAVYFRSGVRASSFSGGTLTAADVCWPMIYINRQLVSTGGLGGAGAEPTALDDLVATADVWALEVYRSPAEIPAEFNGPNAGCGVIVLWTRRSGS
ncbi:MAG TPA: carboxypeptidase regulatory-like domain-containing protein [Longimicrobiales bacterium]|nr:carboxypeptidase regulatory-like domain-containing protein [Longimicrobiales bacterium]